MKKISKIIAIAMIALIAILSLTGCVDSYEQTASSKSQEVSNNLAQTAVSTITVPKLSYFQERRTIAKWAERFDKPGVITYVYLISYGNFIGYYVVDGKPASTRSYLTPEQTFAKGIDVGDSYGDVLVEAPDVDGTYGENNPGIRFFTAEGTAVEWGGSGASYLYSDQPLPINVPKLNRSN